MKFHAKSTNTERLLFNDLGKVVKGVAPQERFIGLKPDDSIYLPEGENVLYSAQAGDAHRYAAAGLLDINDAVAIAGVLTAIHNFGFIPNITVMKAAGATWIPALAADFTAVTNAAMTQTVVTNLSGVAIQVRIG